MRGSVLTASLLLAGMAAAQPTPVTDGTTDPGVAGATRSGKHHAGTHKHHAVRPEAAPAQPQGMVGGAGGPGGATCAGGRGDGPHSKHRSGNRSRIDPLTGAPSGRHGGKRCAERS